MASGLCNPVANYKFKKWLPDYIIRNIIKGYFWKLMEVREEGMEVQKQPFYNQSSPTIWKDAIFGEGEWCNCLTIRSCSIRTHILKKINWFYVYILSKSFSKLLLSLINNARIVFHIFDIMILIWIMINW